MHIDIPESIDTSKIYRGWGLKLPVIEDGSLSGIPTDSEYAIVFSIFSGRHALNGHLYTRAALWAIWDLIHLTDLINNGVSVYVVCDESFRAEIQPYFSASGFENVLWLPAETYHGYSMHNRKFISLRHDGLKAFDKFLHIDAFLWWWRKSPDSERASVYEWLSGWKDQLCVTNSEPKYPSLVSVEDTRKVDDAKFFEVVGRVEGRDPEVSREFWCENPQLSIHGGIFGLARSVFDSDWFHKGIETLSEVTHSDEVVMSVLFNKHLSESDFYMYELPWIAGKTVLDGHNPYRDCGVLVSNWQTDEVSDAWIAYRESLLTGNS